MPKAALAAVATSVMPPKSRADGGTRSTHALSGPSRRAKSAAMVRFRSPCRISARTVRRRPSAVSKAKSYVPGSSSTAAPSTDVAMTRSWWVTVTSVRGPFRSEASKTTVGTSPCSSSSHATQSRWTTSGQASFAQVRRLCNDSTSRPSRRRPWALTWLSTHVCVVTASASAAADPDASTSATSARRRRRRAHPRGGPRCERERSFMTGASVGSQALRLEVLDPLGVEVCWRIAAGLARGASG